MVVELHEHQKKPIKQLDSGKILCGDVGSGKTITSLAYFFTKECGGELNKLESLKTPKDLYIITTAKKRDTYDWQKDAALFSIVQDPAYSVGNIKLTVDSWNNIDKYKEVKDAFFIFDEQRLVGSGAWTKSFIKIAKHNRWILLSATPGDTWLDYIPVFVANGFYRNRTEFKRQHVVYNTFSKFPKVDRYISVGRLIKHRNNLLVEMPMERHTTRHIQEICVDYDVDKFEMVVKKRWHVYENRPLRDVAELFSVMRKVVNSDSSRLDHLRSLTAKHPKLIVFYNFDYELEQLRKLIWEPPMKMSEFERSSDTELEVRSTSRQKSNPSLEMVKNSLSPRSNEVLESLMKAQSSGLEPVDGSRRKSGSSSVKSSISSNARGTSSSSTKRFTDLTQTSSMKTPGVYGREQTQRPQESTRTGSDQKVVGSTTAQPWVGDSSDSETFGGTALTVAEWNGHKHEKIPETDRWVYLVQYRAGSEGWNCTETDAMVFYSLTYSYKDFHQAHGRIDRLDTPFSHLYYYILKSNSLIDKAVAKSLRMKKNFNERDLVKNWQV